MNAPTQTPTGTQIARPRPSDFKPLAELSVGDLLEDPRVRKAMAESVPKHLSPDRMLRVMAQAMRKTPKLAKAHPLSLLGAMISCASLGLEPNTPLGHAHLIPFEKRGKVNGQWQTVGVDINLIIGYQGLIDLARRSGNLVSIHADVVYEGDEFSYEYGSNMHLRHVPIGDREGRTATHAYCHAKLEDGEAFEVLPYARVLKIRDNAEAYKYAMTQKARGDKNWATTPWVAYEHEMACKTMVRRVSKWLPKSIEFATAAQMDALAERGMIDFQAIARSPELARDPEYAVAEEITAEPTQQSQPPQPTQAQANGAAAKATAQTQAPSAQLTEEEEREADRMSRAAQEGGDTDDAGEGDAWGGYIAKMADELKAAKTNKAVADVNATFRDAVMGAVERNELSEEEGDGVLSRWKPLVEVRENEIKPNGKNKK